MSHPLISIIIPVYNCRNSTSFIHLMNMLQNQTESRFEILLCDDGSTDGTADLCDDFSRKDSRIKVIRCTKHGVSATRNSGIDNAQGIWIIFIDSDDYVTDVFVESMLVTTNKFIGIDMVFGSYAIASSNSLTLQIFDSKCYLGKEEIRDAICSNKILSRCSPWGKLFKHRIIEDYHIRFDVNLPHSEDRHFIYQYLIHVSSIACTSIVGYIYGNFSLYSLKHQKHSIDILLLRQKMLTDSALNLLKEFSIPNERSYIIGYNLLNLIKDACVRIFEDERIKQKCIVQKMLLSEYFSTTISSIFMSDPRLKKAIDSDIDLNLLLSGQFKKFNRRYYIYSWKTRLHQILNRLLCQKSEGCSYDKWVFKQT